MTPRIILQLVVSGIYHHGQNLYTVAILYSSKLILHLFDFNIRSAAENPIKKIKTLTRALTYPISIQMRTIIIVVFKILILKSTQHVNNKIRYNEGS